MNEETAVLHDPAENDDDSVKITDFRDADSDR